MTARLLAKLAALAAERRKLAVENLRLLRQRVELLHIQDAALEAQAEFHERRLQRLAAQRFASHGSRIGVAPTDVMEDRGTASGPDPASAPIQLERRTREVAHLWTGEERRRMLDEVRSFELLAETFESLRRNRPANRASDTNEGHPFPASKGADR